MRRSLKRMGRSGGRASGGRPAWTNEIATAGRAGVRVRTATLCAESAPTTVRSDATCNGLGSDSSPQQQDTGTSTLAHPCCIASEPRVHERSSGQDDADAHRYASRLGSPELNACVEAASYQIIMALWS